MISWKILLSQIFRGQNKFQKAEEKRKFSFPIALIVQLSFRSFSCPLKRLKLVVSFWLIYEELIVHVKSEVKHPISFPVEGPVAKSLPAQPVSCCHTTERNQFAIQMKQPWNLPKLFQIPMLDAEHYIYYCLVVGVFPSLYSHKKSQSRTKNVYCVSC